MRKYEKIFLIVIGLFGILFLTYRYIAPYGKIVYYRFTSKIPGSQETTIFSPVKDNILKIPTQVITTGKSKLQLKLLSSDVDSIKATLKFKPTVNEIILGVRGNEKDNFYYRPLYRNLIYQLQWPKVEENGITFFQKEQKYNSISDFVNNPPWGKTTAFYFLDKSKLPKPKISQTNNNITRINTSLRGSHRLLIKVDASPLFIKIDKQDMNGYEGEDKLKIAVSDTEKKLIEKTIEDDGITDASRLKAQPQEETIIINDAPSGLYQVDLYCESKGEDILINKIEINQAKVIFQKHILFLGDKPTTLWTNSKKINIVTAHKQSFQIIKLNDKYDLEIKEEGELYEFNLESITNKEGAGLYKLESPKNDINVLGSGYFSFNLDSFFLPEMFGGTEPNTLDTLDNVDYLLTSYPLSKKDGDWLITEAEFNPKDIKIEGNNLYFSLEIPQIAKSGGELEINYLEIAVKSKGLLEKANGLSPTPISTITKTIKEEEKEPEKNIFLKGKNLVFKLFDQTGTFLAHLFLKVFKKEKEISPAAPEGSSPTPSPSPTATPSPSPTPTPKIEIKTSLLIRVLNGGAGKGAAERFVELLKGAGFTNVLAANADHTNYKNATINYRSEDKNEIERIEELLKKNYEKIEKKEIATSSAEIVVIIGGK